ncbi:MAG: tetratricopeptide repeat protein, partial [Anaerolineae bacterium]
IGQAWQWKGDTAGAQKWFEQALTKISQSRTQITDLIRGRVYAGMGLLYMHKGDYVRAERWSLDAVAVLEQTGQLSDLAKPLNTLGGAYYFQNQWAEASTYVERALNIRRQIGDRLGVAGSLSNLGILYTVGCQWERAIDVFNQSIAMCKEIGALEVTLSNALNNVAYLYIHQGKLDVAEQHLQESLTIKQTAGTTLDVPETLNNLALSRLMQGRLKEADDFISQSIGLCQQTNNNDSLSEAYWYRAKIKLAAGEIEAAHDVCRQAILLANQVMSKINEGGALRVLAKIQLQQQQYRQAKQTAAISRRILTQINLDYEVARTQLVLAEIAKLTGDEAEFRAAVEAAMPVFERLGAAPALNTLKSLQNRPAEAG